MNRKILQSAALVACASAICGVVAQDQQRPFLKDFDSLGAWFDEVASINLTTRPEDLEKAKNKTIAIVGAGITGLTTGLMLDSVGIHNWEIIEANNEVGGRLRTKYVGGTQEWAEMGAMRLPHSATYESDNQTIEYSDHAMTFQLIDWLNEMNKASGNHDLHLDLIPWIQHSPNELLASGTGRHPDGSVPTRQDIINDPSLGEPSPMSTQEYDHVEHRMDRILKNETTLRSIQKDPWRVHKQVMDSGLDEISQQSMMRNLWHASINVTDAIHTSSDYDVFWDEMHHNSNLAQDGGPNALARTYWKCIDGGFSRLARATLPHIGPHRLILNRKIRSIEAISNNNLNETTGTKLAWVDSDINNNSVTTTKPREQDQTKEYSYTLVTAPFTVTRMFSSLPLFSSVLNRAISSRGLEFKDACKVALLFRHRFWEDPESFNSSSHLAPIFGGYSQPADSSIGALYYPVYHHHHHHHHDLNETNRRPRPGLILHYRGGTYSSHFLSLSPDEHVNMVLDAVASLHGEEVTRREYTGQFERVCWLEESNIATSWTRPGVEQHRLYIPAYFGTEANVIFMGEHTSPTHAWISSSLFSAVRGTVQVLMEMGLYEEAKEVNGVWMGRWIDNNNKGEAEEEDEEERGEAPTS